MANTSEKSRSVARVVQAVKTVEGAGFVVNRPFPTKQLMELDPFLLLDEMGPVELGAGEAKGAPDHPHRGFETVTYMLHGRMEHRDSQGNAGKLEPGDVQWMTAGGGVIHSEMPESDFARRGGRMHGFQLWVNLPQRDKMMRPRYQEIPSDKIPSIESPDGKIKVRVIAGEAMGAKAVIDTRTPISYLHYTLAPGARIEQKLPTDYACFAYVFEGAGEFGSSTTAAGEHQLVMFAKDGETISAAATGPSSLEFLLVGGVPLDEPIARYGPFVMNTKEEIMTAIRDYQSGHFGTIPPLR
ncbi:MAG TPA: pirin family protein [Candidatus Binataceae bacterium]|nr:pirin family protein [Candidatus Binataceae bacterium]